MNKPVLPVSSLSLKLPTADGSLETYRLAASRTFPAKLQGTLNRVAFSAAHVVADPLADVDPWLNAAIDWDRTIAFREHCEVTPGLRRFVRSARLPRQPRFSQHAPLIVDYDWTLTI